MKPDNRAAVQHPDLFPVVGVPAIPGDDFWLLNVDDRRSAAMDPQRCRPDTEPAGDTVVIIGNAALFGQTVKTSDRVD